MHVNAELFRRLSYTNTPVGLNFLIVGYVYSQGKMAFDPETSIANAQFHNNTEVLAYVRSLETTRATAIGTYSKTQGIDRRSEIDLSRAASTH